MRTLEFNSKEIPKLNNLNDGITTILWTIGKFRQEGRKNHCQSSVISSKRASLWCKKRAVSFDTSGFLQTSNKPPVKPKQTPLLVKLMKNGSIRIAVCHHVKLNQVTDNRSLNIEGVSKSEAESSCLSRSKVARSEADHLHSCCSMWCWKFFSPSSLLSIFELIFWLIEQCTFKKYSQRILV